MSRASRPDPHDPAASIRARIAAGRSMGALKDAKELAKRSPGPEADALLIEAYRARVADLVRQGMNDEARELLRVATARLPAAAGIWEAAGVQAARAAGDLDDLLLAWRDAVDDEGRAAVAADLEGALTDLAVITDSAILAADDALRAGAKCVQAAFVDAADGTLTAARHAELGAAALPAPLRSWHHFVLALAAFHRHDDAAARAALAQVDDHSGVAPGKRFLLDLLAAALPKDMPPAARRLTIAVTDGAQSAYAALSTLCKPASPARDKRAAARTLLTELAPRRPRVATRLVWYLRGEPEYEALVHELDATLGTALFGEDWLRQVADLDAEVDAVVGTTAWLTWLMPEPKGDALRPLSDLELAELLQHLMPIAGAAAEDIAERLRPEVADALADPSRLVPLLQSWHDEAQEPEVEYAADCAFVLGEVMRRLRAKTGVVPRLQGVGQLGEHAVALDPRPERFAALLRELDDDEPELRVSVLTQWAAAVPGDVDAWLQLMSAHEARAADAEAAASLQRAVEVAPDDPRVRMAQMRVRVRAVRAHVRAGEPSVASLVLTELEQDAETEDLELRAYLVAARHALDTVDAAAVLAVVDDPVRAAASIDVARVDLLGESVDPHAHGLRPRDALARAAWLVRTSFLSDSAADLAVVPDGRWSRSDVPADQGDRLALCTLGSMRDDWELAEVASGVGLLDDGPALASFVLHRAVAVAHLEDEPDLVQDLVALAGFLATRDGDEVTRRAADALRSPLADDLDPTTAAAILADERAYERGTRAVIADHARPLSARERLQRRRALGDAGAGDHEGGSERQQEGDA